MSFDNGAKITTNGLVFCVDSADLNSYPGSGTSWRDMSGNNRTGTLVNSPTYTNTNGGYFTFNGSNNSVTFSDTGLPSGNATRSVSMWFRVAAIGNVYYAFINFGTINGTGRNYAFQWANSYLRFNTDNNITMVYQTAGAISINTWYNMVMTWDGTTHRGYLDGVDAFGTNTTALNTLLNGTMYFSNDGGGVGSGNLNGGIAHVMIYNRALSAAEVLQNFNALKSRYKQ